LAFLVVSDLFDTKELQQLSCLPWFIIIPDPFLKWHRIAAGSRIGEFFFGSLGFLSSVLGFASSLVPMDRLTLPLCLSLGK
jgi:hypothetical protein